MLRSHNYIKTLAQLVKEDVPRTSYVAGAVYNHDIVPPEVDGLPNLLVAHMLDRTLRNVEHHDPDDDKYRDGQTRDDEVLKKMFLFRKN